MLRQGIRVWRYDQAGKRGKHHQPGGLRSARTKSRRELEIQVLEGMLLPYGVGPYRYFFIKEIPLLEHRIARHLKS